MVSYPWAHWGEGEKLIEVDDRQWQMNYSAEKREVSMAAKKEPLSVLLEGIIFGT